VPTCAFVGLVAGGLPPQATTVATPSDAARKREDLSIDAGV
jgi:hypothetical protein